MSRYVDEHRDRFGVEPICRTLGVSVSAHYERASGRRSLRAVEDERLLGRIRELHASNYYAYGYRRMWLALRRAGEQAGRGRVQRLMRANGIVGAKRRGKPWRTTQPDPQAQRRPDLVQRDFHAAAPNRLWVADISCLRRSAFGLASGLSDSTTGLPSEAAGCLDQPPGLADRLIPFADGARPFYAYVAVGNDAEPATLDEALGILDTLRVAQRD